MIRSLVFNNTALTAGERQQLETIERMFQDKVTALLKMSQYKSEAMKQIDELMRHIGDLERELDN